MRVECQPFFGEGEALRLQDYRPPPRFIPDRKAGRLTIEFRDFLGTDTAIQRRTFWAPAGGGEVLEVLDGGRTRPAYVRLYDNGKPLTLRPGLTLWALIKREYIKRQESIIKMFDYGVGD